MNLKDKHNINDLMYESNIATLLCDDDLKTIGMQVVRDFDNDLMSRSSWEKRTEASLKLALQVAETKNFPWANASNVKFPLITIAALQYHARSYPVLIDSDLPVKCRVVGDDKDGLKALRSTRVEQHMSYQLLEEDEDWESEMDKVLITQPIIGCAFKKTYYDPICKHNISENVLAKDLVVNYWTKSLETASRVSHGLQMTKNEIYERVARGLWLDVSEGRQQQSMSAMGNPLQQTQDKAQGLTPPEPNDSSTPIEIIEQHCHIDFDDDGYAEPYIVYVRRDNRKVARIVARYIDKDVERNKEGTILSIKGEQYFTKYPFIPSPDGGFYDLGFGVLLGPLNESINTIINQLVDAGTLSNTAGGFLSRGIKLRGGNYSFNPMEWKHVDTTGDDLRKGIVPLPVREPSQVMFTLLNLLINYGERIGGAVDIMTGQNPGQNTPAETTRTMAEQGMKIFNGIFKRTHRSLKQEFRKLYRLNQIFITEDKSFVSDAKSSGMILASDYAGPVTDVMPTADPSVTSDAQRLNQASAIAQRVAATPGLYNRYEAEYTFLKAMKVTNIEKILPDPKGPNAVPPPVNPKIQIEQLKQQAKQASDQLTMKMALLKLMSEAEVNQAQIQKLEAEAEAIKIGIATEGEKMRIQEINMQIALQRERREGVISSIQTMNSVYDTMMKNKMEEAPESSQPQMPPMQMPGSQPQGMPPMM
jgi:chaperonin GroES